MQLIGFVFHSSVCRWVGAVPGSSNAPSAVLQGSMPDPKHPSGGCGPDGLRCSIHGLGRGRQHCRQCVQKSPLPSPVPASGKEKKKKKFRISIKFSLEALAAAELREAQMLFCSQLC